MSKTVLISIQPQWVEKIASDEKTIEVRKSRPKLEPPFKCYIYETKGKQIEHCDGCDITYHGRGKVIGEFVCDGIDEFHSYELEPSKRFYDIEKARLDLFLKESCLSYNEVCNYRKNLPYFKPLYGWHISDLKIYDKPKELSEFKKENVCYKSGDWETLGCWEGGCVHQELGECDGRCSVLYRPPQNWCYVEAK